MSYGIRGEWRNDACIVCDDKMFRASVAAAGGI